MSLTTFPQHILRAYDIRGLYPQEINEDLFYKFGQAFGTLIANNQGQKVCVGRDGRLSSPTLTTALVRGLIATGMTVYDIGCGPSPLLYYAEKILQPDGALMVTGSHNSKDFNGLKMILQQQPFFGEQIQTFGQEVLAAHSHEGQGQMINHDLTDSYIKRLTDEFYQYYQSGRPLKVVWDPGHGATAVIVKTLVQHLPGKHTVINDVIDGSFPAHHPDPTIENNLQQLRQIVVDNEYDLGIGFDGDGDRIGIIDNHGHFISGDQFLLLYAEEVLYHNPGATILADVKASQTVFDRIGDWGGRALMVATGHSNIKHKMRETGALLAGEMSGHVFFADRYYGYDDALYAAIRTLGIISMSNSSLNCWRQNLPVTFNTPEIKIPCSSQDKAWIIKHLRNALQHDNLNFDITDGARVKFLGGWWLLRASNTEECLIGRVEGSSPEHRDVGHQQLMHYLQQAQLMVENNR